MIAFFDASALIYLLEGKAPFVERVRAELTQLARTLTGDAEFKRVHGLNINRLG